MSLYILKSPEIKANCLQEIAALQTYGNIEVLIREHRTKRSLQQNALYHKWKQIISDHSGYEAEYLHELFKANFIGYRVINTNDGIFKATKSTTELDTKQFTEFLEKVEMFAGQYELNLPQPKHYGYDAI